MIVEGWQVLNLVGKASGLRTKGRAAHQVQRQPVSEAGRASAADGGHRQSAGRLSSCSERGDRSGLSRPSADWVRITQHYGEQSALLI